MHINELDTPSLLLDLDIMERNLERMAAYCAATGVKLRPHIKTHKSPILARRQIDMGAIGIAAAKPGEAEIMAAGGIDDILIAYPIVSRKKADHFLSLSEQARLSVSIDSTEAAEVLSSAAAARGYDLALLVEIDVGFGRCGVQDAAAAVSLARHIESLPSVHFEGLMFYPGHMMVPPERANEILPSVNARIEAAYEALTQAGFDIRVVSGGSSPMAFRSQEFSHLTEIRPGMYPLNDRNLVTGGFATLSECALTLLTTVVSNAVPNRMMLDGGSKTFSSDRLLTGDHLGFGALVDDPAALLYGLSEEHGHVDLTNSTRSYKIGDRIRVIPNHCCTAINMHDRIYGVRGETVEEIFPVAARGCVQ